MPMVHCPTPAQLSGFIGGQPVSAEAEADGSFVFEETMRISESTVDDSDMNVIVLIA